MQIDGSADITFDVPYLYKLSADYGSTYYGGYGPSEYIDITVNVTEGITGASRPAYVYPAIIYIYLLFIINNLHKL